MFLMITLALLAVLILPMARWHTCLRRRARNGTINNNGTLHLDNTIGTLFNALTGSDGEVLLSNNASVQLAGDNSGYSGLFTNQAGSILIANSAEHLGGSSIANSGALILDTGSVWELTNTISGTGTLVKRGSGTVKLKAIRLAQV